MGTGQAWLQAVEDVLAIMAGEPTPPVVRTNITEFPR